MGRCAARGAAWGDTRLPVVAPWLGVVCLGSALACLPSEDISSYSSGLGRAAPGVAQEGAAPEAPQLIAGDQGGDVASAAGSPEAPSGPADPGDGAAGQLVSEECNGDCVVADLPLLLDAGAPEQEGGSVAPSGVAVSPGDAGAVSTADAEPPPAPVGPCGQGAVVAPDDRCFALITAASAWSDARDACQDRGAGWDLAVIRSAQENGVLAGMLAAVTDAWVGANDLAQEGSWRWLGDNNAFFTGTGAAGSAAAGAYVNWNTGGTPEPNGGAASDCLRLRSSGGWADIACTSTFAALCEGPQP